MLEIIGYSRQSHGIEVKLACFLHFKKDTKFIDAMHILKIRNTFALWNGFLEKNEKNLPLPRNFWRTELLISICAIKYYFYY